MIFDATCNRSSRPGQVRFCGVANFTMVRMFHPVWCSVGSVPKDMVSIDKKRCRANYIRLIQGWQARNGHAGSTSTVHSHAAIRARPAKRGRGVQRPKQVVTGRAFRVRESSSSDAMDMSDDADTDADTDADCVTDDESDDESGNDDQRPQAKRPPVRDNSTDSLLRAIEGSQHIAPKEENAGSELKTEDSNEAVTVINLLGDGNEDDDEIEILSTPMVVTEPTEKNDGGTGHGMENRGEEEENAAANSGIKAERENAAVAIIRSAGEPREVIDLTIDDDD